MPSRSRQATPEVSQFKAMLPARYRVVRELGRGGMGVVHHAVDLVEHRDVAVKTLSSKLGNDLVALLRFNREARTASSLSHPNICRIFDIGRHRSHPYIVMEMLEGETVKSRLAGGRCHTALVLGIAAQTAAGLEAAHSNFIIHRDIKPANVFITVSGVVKILDFGLAKHFVRLDQTTSVTVTDPTHTPGTVDYMSPEQLLGHRLDQRTDLFSLGAMIYEVLTGRRPFRGGSNVETIAAILNSPPPPLPRIPYGTEWSRVLNRLLAKDPDQRYSGAAALLDDLALFEQLTKGESVSWPQSDALHEAPGLPSLAVVPFEFVGGVGETEERRREVEYFGHGLLDELIAGLSKVKGLRVVPRTLALRSKGDRRSMARLGRRLQVDRMLGGTVQSRGDRISVVLTLFGVGENEPLWLKRYELGAEDLFRLRDEVVHDVAAEFQLVTDGVTRSQPHEIANRRAFHLCLKGRFFWSKRYEGGLLTARQCFEEAIRVDPRLALAHAGLADTHSFMGFYCLVRPRTAFALAKSSTAEALRLDPALADAHASLGLIKLGGDWDWNGSMQAFERALTLNPAHALARIYLSWVLVLLGRSSEAHIHAERAQDVDPLSPMLNAGAAYTYFLSRAYEQGIRECEKALEVDKDFLVALYVMGMCKAQLGMSADAILELERVVALSGGMPFYLGLLGKLYADTHQMQKVEGVLRRLDELAGRVYVPPHCYVYIHAGRGDFDAAFAWHDRAYEDGASPFNYFSPLVECLHGDPRFQSHVRRWGLEL